MECEPVSSSAGSGLHPLPMAEEGGVDARLILKKLSPNGTVQKILSTREQGAYVIGPQLGVGGISRVMSARNLTTGKAVAIKIIEKGYQADTTLSNEFRANREISCLASLEHPNVVGFLSAHRSDDSIFIVQELVNGISLLDYLKHKGNRIKVSAALHIFYQAVQAICYCHSQGVYHRDLKLENMIVSINGTVQIIDFDLAEKCDPNAETEKLKQFCGTPHIACPEIWRAEPYYGEKADVWSLGVIFYVLLTGAYPFDGDCLEELRDEILSGDLFIPRDLPGPMKNLLQAMLHPKMDQRIGSRGLANHTVVTSAAAGCQQRLQAGARALKNDVKHPWMAPTVDGDKTEKLAKQLEGDIRFNNSSPRVKRRRPSITPRTTPIWEMVDSTVTPSSSEKPVAPPSPQSNACVSPDRKSIFRALDWLLDSDGLSMEDQKTLLENAVNDTKLAADRKEADPSPPPLFDDTTSSSKTTPVLGPEAAPTMHMHKRKTHPDELQEPFKMRAKVITHPRRPGLVRTFS
mmetsp:Transcript_6599/g.12412  ORF Transcript_6599/g.12412 Transcript_6599/m.12412 type:complete len:519 (-) Transcript_6599:580-2136(-)